MRPAASWQPPTVEATLRVLAVLLLVAGAFVVWPVRGAVVFAVVLGFLAHPLHARLVPKVKKAWISGLLVTMLVLVLLVAPVLALGALLARQAAAVAATVEDGSGLLARAEQVLESWGVPDGLAGDSLRQGWSAAASWLGEQAAGAFSGALTFALHLVLFMILLYFVIVDGGRAVRFLRDVVPVDRDRLEGLLERTAERTKALVYGSVLIAIVQGVVAGVGWWVLGLPSPVFWGLIMTLFALLPVLGPFVVLLPATILAFLDGRVVQGVGLLVLNFIAVGLIDDMLRPWVVGRWSGVHPAVVLVGIVGGVPAFGWSGLVLGPLLLSLVAPALRAWLSPERPGGFEPEGAPPSRQTDRRAQGSS